MFIDGFCMTVTTLVFSHAVLTISKEDEKEYS